MRDATTGLVWQRVPTSDARAFAAAATYCAALVEGGADDWRMPTAEELLTIFVPTATPPFDATVFGGPGDDYWTSTVPTDLVDARFVLGRAVTARFETEQAYVRCAREDADP